MELPGDIATWLPFGVTVGAIALAAGLACVVLFMRRHTDALLRRADEKMRLTEAQYQREEAIVSSEPGALYVWRPNDTSGQPLTRSGAANMLSGCLEAEEGESLKDAISALSAQGSLFSLTLPGADGRVFQAYGKPAAGQAAVWLRDVTPDTEAAYSLSVRLSGSEEEREHLGEILDASPMPVWRRGPDLDLIWVNRAYTAAVEAQTATDAVTEQIELDRHSRDLAELALEKEEPQHEKHYVVVGGHRRAFDVHAVPLGDGVASYAIDVTEIDDAKRLLQQHIDAHEETLDRLPAAVAIFGPDQRLQFSNKAYARLWDLEERWLDTHPSEGDILEKLREHARLPEQRDFASWKRERLALYTSIVDSHEELWHLPRGITLRVNCQPHPFGGLIFVFADVTDQLLLERSLNQLANVQRTTLDHLAEGVAVFGTDGRLKLFNEAYAEMWEIEAQVLVDRPRFADIFTLCHRLLPDEAHWSTVTTLITGTGNRTGKGNLNCTNDKVFSYNAAPLPDGSLLLTYRDVTDAALKEKALEERNAALLAADKLKSDFISNVSYQLRTPLNSIMGFADLMQQGIAGKISDKQKGYLADIMNASKTLETLINDILDLALIEAGRMELDLSDVQIGDVLTQVRSLVEERAHKAKVFIVCDNHPSAGHLYADQKRLLQICYNLLINAIEHTPPNGTVTYGADAIGGEMRLYVNDTGVGIPPEYQPVAFERFESTTKSKDSRRAGLGLALVRSFVEMHGGWVELDSAVGKGTRVICHLPREQRAKQPASATSKAARQPKRAITKSA
ncbi:MAG: PAS domain-containing protein [Alphaproteobacteria bacterium]|nr:PAS domain-containing protein [Alphaproteobacteria bacterium]